MTHRSRFTILALSLLLPGCPEENVGDPDVGTTLDAATPPDVPEEMDAPVSDDMDMDGVVTSMDCDDTDPEVGLTATRPCSSVCGEGIERCIAGEWDACSVATECLCAVPGETRTAPTPCARCGRGTETCSAGNRWELTSCTDMGVCEVGATETAYAETCLATNRTCAADCTWGDWVDRFPMRDCNVPNSCTCYSEDNCFPCLDDCTEGRSGTRAEVCPTP